MGVYAPLSFVTPAHIQEFDDTIIQPTLDELGAET